MILQLSEVSRQFEERRAIPKRSGLALNNHPIVPPVADRPCWQHVAALYHTGMFPQDVALGRNHQRVGIDPQADGPVRKRSRDTVAIASKLIRHVAGTRLLTSMKPAVATSCATANLAAR